MEGRKIPRGSSSTYLVNSLAREERERRTRRTSVLKSFLFFRSFKDSVPHKKILDTVKLIIASC